MDSFKNPAFEKFTRTINTSRKHDDRSIHQRELLGKNSTLTNKINDKNHE
jgi:hypothetical protein